MVVTCPYNKYTCIYDVTVAVDRNMAFADNALTGEKGGGGTVRRNCPRANKVYIVMVTSDEFRGTTNFGGGTCRRDERNYILFIGI